MSCELMETINIETSLSQFEDSDLYIAGLNLIKMMGYPLIPSNEAINDEIFQFIFLKIGTRTQFNKQELFYLKEINSISVLCNLQNGFRQERFPYYDKIIFIAVDLACNVEDRSSYATHITRILSKVFDNAIVLLFRNKKCIMFSGILYAKNSKEEQVFLSDWYNILYNDHEQLMTFSKMFFYNFKIDSLEEVYYDILFAMAREYMVNPISYVDVEKFSIYDDFVYEEIRERQKENILYYKELYGDDYVDNNEKIDLLLPEADEWILEDFDERVLEEIKDEEQNETKSTEYDDEIGEDYLEDPIKMLKWLEDKGNK